MHYPKIAIVGKPNVGKSTLFNRICRRRLAIVTDQAGTTRDCKEYDVDFYGVEFTLIDTAGWEYNANKNNEDSIHSAMILQTEKGINEADLVMFIIDGRSNLTFDDLQFADLVRKSSKRVLLVMNKSESKIALGMNDYMPLGFGEPICIAAEHGLGFDLLRDALAEHIEILKKDKIIETNTITEKVSPSENLGLVLVGRPNAGKSTIFNQLVGFNKNIVSEKSGTTRDAITHNFSIDNINISLIDTAGLRKKSRIDNKIESISAGQSITAIRRANVVALVIDSSNGLESQDLAITNIVINEGKGLFLIFNKHDLIKDKKELQDKIQYIFEHSLTSIINIPVIHTNALKGIDTRKIIETATKIKESWESNISTARLNEWLQEATDKHPPSFGKDGRRIKFKYITQIKSKPPTFKIFCNLPSEINSHYINYLSHSLQQRFSLSGTPVRISFAKTDNPYFKQ